MTVRISNRCETLSGYPAECPQQVFTVTAIDELLQTQRKKSRRLWTSGSPPGVDLGLLRNTKTGGGVNLARCLNEFSPC
jgi:hypothetical protein